jgi:flagellar basal-body rod protein FlgG
MDFALEGRGFFEVEDPFGNILYTRGGDFYFTNTPEGLTLVNASGYFVHDENGERIIAPDDTSSVDVTQQGRVSFTGGAEDAEVQFGMYTFENETGLAASGKGNFEETDASGERRVAGNTRVRQGYLEGSNVNLGVEFTRLIRSQRAFQLASRAVKTADDMEGIANSMRR